MSSAIQSFFSPPGAGVKQGGAAELFSAEGKGHAFSDVLAGESSRGAARGAVEKAQPVGRPERGEGEARDSEVKRGATEADGDARDAASAEVDPSADSRGDAETQGGARDAGPGEGEVRPEEDVEAVDESQVSGSEPGVATPVVAAQAEAATPASEAVAASVSPVEAAAAAQSGQALPGDRPQQGAVDARRGEAQVGKLAMQQGGAGETLLDTTAMNVNPVSASASTAAVATDDADTTPLVLQPVAAGSVSADASTATQVAPTATATAAPVADAAPGPIVVQGANPSAGAQLAEAHAARSDENAALNNARLARGLASAVNQKGGAVTLRLTPPEMGTVRIQMQLSGTTLAASFHAETASAHQMLSQQLGQLRTSLETQGLHVERLSVQPMQPTQQGNSAGSQNDDAQQQNHQPNDGRSRGQAGRDSGSQRDARQDGDPSRGDDARQPATFDEHLGSAPADRDR